MKKALNSVAKENTVKESPSPVESASTKPAAQLQGVPQSLLEKVRTASFFFYIYIRQDEESICSFLIIIDKIFKKNF